LPKQLSSPFHPQLTSTDKLLSAQRDFTEYYPYEKSGIIMTIELTLLGAVDLWIMFLFFDGPTPPSGVFINFTDIGPIMNSCNSQSYAALITGYNWSVVRGSAYTITTENIPLPNVTVGLDVLGCYYDHWETPPSPSSLFPAS
jgi:hypothetical protein